MPIVIIEGIDGSGKSTLADQIEAKLKEHPGFEVIRQHRGPMKDTVVNEYVKPLLDLAPNQVLIADRWHVGEMIYGPIYRGKSEVRSVIGALEDKLDELGAIKIVLCPPLDVIRRRIYRRGEDFLQTEHIEQVYNFYKNYAGVFDYSLLISPKEPTVNALVKLILEKAKNNVAA